MTTVALCEDNEIQREIMYDLLSDFSDSHKALKITTFSTGRELLEWVRGNTGFDIYILDIIMPDINGMELAATLRLLKDPGLIIFTTASLEYAAASYDVQAFYYLIKPIDRTKFFRVMDNALDSVDSATDMIEVKIKQGIIRLRQKDIMYVEVVDRSLRYHLKDGRICDSVALRGSFRSAIDPLMKDGSFALCGVSKTVNLRYVDAVDSESVLLSDGTQIFPPRSSCSEFRRSWLNYAK